MKRVQKFKSSIVSKFKLIRFIFGFWILIFGVALFSGCATDKVQLSTGDIGSTEFTTSLSVEETWRMLMRFSDKNGYRFINIDSDKGIMEISSGATLASGYSAYLFYYSFILVGQEQGTKIVIEGSFRNSDGKEVEARGYLEQTKRKNEQSMLAEIENFFGTGQNNDSGKRVLP